MRRWSIGLLLLALLCVPALGFAETYIAAGVGMNAPSFDTTDAGKVALQKDLFYGGKIPGADLEVHSLAFNALVRATGYRYKVEPYAGLGIGLNVGNISSGNFRPEASFAPSFNILAGIRYYMTDSIAPFVEYKYNFAQFTFNRSDITADYRANLFMFGIAYHFGR
mgnify:CR=1 FL=1